MSHLRLKKRMDERLKAQLALRALYDEAGDAELSADQKNTEATLSETITRAQDDEVAALEEIERQAKLDEMYEQTGLGRASAGGENATRDKQDDDQPTVDRKFREILRSVGLGESAGVQRVDFGAGFDIQRDDVALVAGTATDGAELVETELDRTLVDYLQESIGAMRAGARIIPTTSGNPITIPTVVSHSTITVEGETDTIARSAPQFSTVSLGAFKYAVLVQASRELLEDAAFPIVPFVIEQATEEIGRQAGTDFITGAGTTVPFGIDTATTNTDTSAAIDTWTGDELIDVFHGIVGPYRMNAQWIMRDSTVQDIRKKKDSTGQYLWQPGLTAGVPDMLLGKPVVTDNAVAALGTGNASLIFGDMRRAYAIRTVNGLDIARSDDFAFDTDLVTWRFVARMDGNLIDERAVIIGSNA